MRNLLLEPEPLKNWVVTVELFGLDGEYPQELGISQHFIIIHPIYDRALTLVSTFKVICTRL